MIAILYAFVAGAVTAVAMPTRPSSSGSHKIHVKPRLSGSRPAEPVTHEAKDTDIEGAPTELTLADLMKHARHDGQGMVSVGPDSKAVSVCHGRACVCAGFQSFPRYSWL